MGSPHLCGEWWEGEVWKNTGMKNGFWKFCVLLQTQIGPKPCLFLLFSSLVHNLREGLNISNISNDWRIWRHFYWTFNGKSFWQFFLFIATGYRSFIHVIITCASIGPWPYFTQVPKWLFRPYIGIIPLPLGHEAGCHFAVPAAFLGRPAAGK